MSDGEGKDEIIPPQEKAPTSKHEGENSTERPEDSSQILPESSFQNADRSERSDHSSNPTSSAILTWVKDQYKIEADAISSSGESGDWKSNHSESRYNLRLSVPTRIKRLVLEPRTVGATARRATKRKTTRKPAKMPASKRRKVRPPSQSSASSRSSKPPASLAAALNRMVKGRRTSNKTKKRSTLNRTSR